MGILGFEGQYNAKGIFVHLLLDYPRRDQLVLV